MLKVLMTGLCMAALAGTAQAATPDAPLKKGAAYAPTRKALLAQGWRPLPDPECQSNVYGGGTPPEDNICKQLPEIEACSGDGYCNMYFQDAAGRRKLMITTYGEYGRWNRPGEEDALAVTSWSYEKK